ncbi:MAG: hypothetical protein ACI9XU_000109, partial [Arenicella sp.]
MQVNLITPSPRLHTFNPLVNHCELAQLSETRAQTWHINRKRGLEHHKQITATPPLFIFMGKQI